jgi:hypothetical protein
MILEVIFAFCPHLQHLDISSSYWVTDKALSLISRRSPPALRSLHLRHCEVTKEKIRDFIENSSLPSLRHLSFLGSCPQELERKIFEKIALPAMMEEKDREAQVSWTSIAARDLYRCDGNCS